MIIDNTPAIRAFCEARIRQLDQFNSDSAWARRDELASIIKLCDGLLAQSELLKGAMKSVLPD